MQTIVELPEFIQRAPGLLKDEEKASIINYLALHPQSGDIMQGTTGPFDSFWQGRESEYLKVRT